MAHDVIKLEYAKAEEMIRTFQQGREQLQRTLQEMQGLATTIEEGALLGQGGDAFVEAIRTKLAQSLTKLSEKFEELAGDVAQAIKYMQEADKTSKAQFK
ncbi:MAG: WXG100 family type VII secretion target [Caldilineales bacterium]